MPLLFVQSIATALAFVVSLQGLSDIHQGLIIGIAKLWAAPLVGLILAKKLNTLYPSVFLVVSTLFIAVILAPSILLPAIISAQSFAFTLFGITSFLALNLWCGYHACWLQTRFFNTDPQA